MLRFKSESIKKRVSNLDTHGDEIVDVLQVLHEWSIQEDYPVIITGAGQKPEKYSAYIDFEFDEDLQFENNLDNIFKRFHLKMFSNGRYIDLPYNESSIIGNPVDRDFDNHFQSYYYEYEIIGKTVRLLFGFDDSTR